MGPHLEFVPIHATRAIRTSFESVLAPSPVGPVRRGSEFRVVCRQRSEGCMSCIELVGNPVSRHLHEPAFERALGWVVFELSDAFGDPEDGLLHDVLRFGVRQTRFERDAIDQLPVSIEEIAPACVVVPVLRRLSSPHTLRMVN